jgi:hypothetical protein
VAPLVRAHFGLADDGGSVAGHASRTTRS